MTATPEITDESIKVGELASVAFTDIESGLMVLDRDCRLVMWNAWMSKAARVASKDAVGKLLNEVFPTITETRVWKAIQSAVKHGMPALLSHTLNKAQFPLYRPFKQTEEVMRQIIVIKPTRIPGLERHCLIQISDVTPSVVREEMLRKQAHELKLAQQMLLEAERKEQERKLQLQREQTEAQMAGGFAHEMRNALSGGNLLLMGILGLENTEAPESTPHRTRASLVDLHKLLTAEGIGDDCLKGVLGILRQINQSEKQIEHVLHSVHSATERALMITKQIMQYSRLGHESKGIQKVDIIELLANIGDEQELDFDSNNVGFKMDLPEAVIVEGDSVQYYSILKNLVQNARDAVVERWAGEAGGLVTVQVISNDRGWQAAIADNGVGMSDEVRAKIFNAFFSTKPETGTGLGLGMVQKLVSLYNGSISVDSAVGEGTTFTIDFMEEAEAENADADAGHTGESSEEVE